MGCWELLDLGGRQIAEVLSERGICFWKIRSERNKASTVRFCLAIFVLGKRHRKGFQQNCFNGSNFWLFSAISRFFLLCVGVCSMTVCNFEKWEKLVSGVSFPSPENLLYDKVWPL